MVTRTRTQVTIRPFAPDDYPAMVALNNALYPDYPSSAEEVRYNDEHRDPKSHFARFVAEHGDTLVAVGACGHYTGMFHPRKFFLGVDVHPDWQGRGIGTTLYDHILASLDPFAPLAVSCQTRSDWASALHFVEARGYVERMRSWESRLDVAAFDERPFAGAEARTAATGIALKTIAELADDPGRDRKLYDLDVELGRDVPSPEPYTPITFAHFQDRVLGDPNLIPEAYFVAVDAATGEYAGMSQLWNSQESADLYNGLTGVKRAYRRRGIALALKLRGIAFARARRCPTIKTWNESNNRAMLSINEALGFAKQPAWIDFVRVLREDGGAVAAPDGKGEG